MAGIVLRFLLPDTDHVSSRVAEGRYPQVALWIRRSHNRAALSDDLLQRLIELLHEDVRHDTRFSDNRKVGHEVPDHMPAAILETGIVAIGIHTPAEHALVEGC